MSSAASQQPPGPSRGGNPRSTLTSGSDSKSVSAVLQESIVRRLKLVRSLLGGGVVPAEDNESHQQGSKASTDSVVERDSNAVERFGGVQLGGAIDRYSAVRAKKQKDIAQILPVTDVKRMSRSHWTDIYALERRYLPVDWYPPKESPILGVKQVNINRDHRHRIVKWMGEACSLFRWTTHTFFTSVHAWDMYMTVAAHEVTTSDLAKLSAACLYFGAQLVESAADENVKPLEEFTELCPEVSEDEVGSTAALREIQAHLVDTLQGVSLVRRTPVDFLLLYLAQMQIAPSPCPELFESLLHQNLLDVLWDFVLAVALTIYANGLVLDGVPGSRWVAGTMLRVLEFACPALRSDAYARDVLKKHVFHITGGSLEQHQTIVMDPIIRSVWQLILEAATNETHEISNNTHEKETNKKPMPYDMIRHYLSPSFPQWPITFPTDRVVQNVSTRLRAISFETCTPPNVYATGPSISASKRAGEKSRRRTNQSLLASGLQASDGFVRPEVVKPTESVVDENIQGGRIDINDKPTKEDTNNELNKLNNNTTATSNSVVTAGIRNSINQTPYYPVES